MAKYPSQMQDKFNLRFPDGMRDAIAERAKKNGRSMNSEIIQILQDTLDANITQIDPSMSPENADFTFEDAAEELKKQLSKKQDEMITIAKAFAELANYNPTKK